MKFGVSIFPTDYSIDIRELGRAAEDAGSSRSGCPSTPTCRSNHSPWPGGAELPKQY